MIFRTQNEIVRRLNKMEPPTPSFVTCYFDQKQKLTITNKDIRFLQGTNKL